MGFLGQLQLLCSAQPLSKNLSCNFQLHRTTKQTSLCSSCVHTLHTNKEKQNKCSYRPPVGDLPNSQDPEAQGTQRPRELRDPGSHDTVDPASLGLWVSRDQTLVWVSTNTRCKINYLPLAQLCHTLRISNSLSASLIYNEKIQNLVLLLTYIYMPTSSQLC